MSPNLIGILAIVASQVCFIVNDSLMKLAASRVPADATAILPLGEAIVLRGAATVLMIAILVLALGQMRDLSSVLSNRTGRKRLGWRAAAEIGASMAYLFAVIGMPIADLVGILQVVPLALTAGAALFLGEPVGWRRWTATLVGFLGVMFIIKPGALPLSMPMVLALLSVTLIVVRDLLTRGLPAGIPVLIISGTSALALTVGGLFLAPFERWIWPSQTQMIWLLVAALHLVGANTFLILSMRVGEIAVVGPFRYSVILIAVLSGYLIWNETPDTWTWVGIAIVTAAGIYMLLREQSLSRPKPLATGRSP
jgi:drug/metabolite transporter (DMT)-like permease